MLSQPNLNMSLLRGRLMESRQEYCKLTITYIRVSVFRVYLWVLCAL